MNRIQLLSIFVTLVLMLVTFELVRRRKIGEQYAVLWFAAELVLLFFAIFDNVLIAVAHMAGIFYPPAVLIPVLMFFVIALSLHFSVVVSRLTRENKKLAQEIGFLKSKMETMYSSPNPTPSDSHEQSPNKALETT